MWKIGLTTLFSIASLCAETPSLSTLLSSLDQESLPQHMAFYELYPETEEGKTALAHAWKLLSCTSDFVPEPFSLPPLDVQAIVSLVTRQASDPPTELSNDQLAIIDKLSAHFPNRKLKGAHVWTREELLKLPNEEIDLCRGLLIEQFNSTQGIRQYEATVDLMALQIAARLSKQATSEEKIRAINRFVFQEMHFRFPPHSLYAKDIDLYTFLPSVLDSRKGVCLGVSILYLCLAQRLDLPLEIITPPGHIYVRCPLGEKWINIETTARGIHLPDETYLGINTRSLQKRNIKEVIGMAFFNQASLYWARGEFEKTVPLYEKALIYQPDDPLVRLFLGMNYLFTGKKDQGRKMLEPLRHFTFDHAVAPETLAADYLSGQVSIDGLKSIFLPVDEDRSSVMKKQQELQEMLKRYPKFRAGLMQLATTYLQLGRMGEGQQVLMRLLTVDPSDPSVSYYLSAICLERLDYNSAWAHLERAEAITRARNHFPRALKAVRHQLRSVCPR